MGKSAVIFSHLQSTKSGEIFILKWDILRGKIHDEMSFGGNVGQIQPTKETLLETFHLTLTTLTINWTGDLNWDKCLFLGRIKLQFLVFSPGKKTRIYLSPFGLRGLDCVKLLGDGRYFLQANAIFYPSKWTNNMTKRSCI